MRDAETYPERAAMVMMGQAEHNHAECDAQIDAMGTDDLHALVLDARTLAVAATKAWLYRTTKPAGTDA